MRVWHGALPRLDTRQRGSASGLAQAGRAVAAAEQRRSRRATAAKAMATMSDGCRVAAARVSCGTTASQLVAERRESLARCSAEARHSAERLSKRAGAGWTCTGSSRAAAVKQSDGCQGDGYHEQWLSWRCSTRFLAAALQRHSWWPSGVRVWHGALNGALPRLDTRQSGLASGQAQGGRAVAASTPCHAERRLPGRWLP